MLPGTLAPPVFRRVLAFLAPVSTRLVWVCACQAHSRLNLADMSPARHPRIAERKKGRSLRRVPGQLLAANLGKAELAREHVKRRRHLCRRTSFESFHLVGQCVNGIRLVQDPTLVRTHHPGTFCTCCSARLVKAADRPSVRCSSGTPPKRNNADCSPVDSAMKLSPPSNTTAWRQPEWASANW